MGVRKTNCRGRLTRSGTIAGSLPQLANMLTIQELQTCKRSTRINVVLIKKPTYLFGEPLASVHKCLRICDLCKELGIFVYTRILQRSGSGKPRPTLVWCLCAR